MKIFVANIDEKNFHLIHEASQNSGIEYQKGVKMTSNGIDEKEHISHPIFCKSISEAAILIKEYTEIKAKSTILGKDQILRQVLIEMHGV